MTTRNKIDTAFLKSYKKYQSLLKAVDVILWEADIKTFKFTFISDSVAHILGYQPKEWLGNDNFFFDHVFAEDRQQVEQHYRAQLQLARSTKLDYRMVKADGSIAWVRSTVSAVQENGQPKWLCGIMEDITGTKLLTDLERLEKQVLELNSQKGTDLEAVLDFYVRGIERLFPQMKCSVLRVSDGKLYRWASPSLPDAYTSLIDNLGIGPNTGSCGTAAYEKQRVIVNDIEHDEKWANYKQFALPHNLRACWSYPITDSHGDVIAVFGIYYDTVKIPNEYELDIIERSAALLKIIVEHRLYAWMTQEMNLLVTQGQELANFGTWQWDIINNKVTWSDVLYRIYGRDGQTYKATLDGYIGMLHPSDRQRVQHTIEDALNTHKDIVYEERIVRPDGDIRHLKSWGRVALSESGKPVKMIGACLDITQAKTTEIKMEEIAWMQSHVIRAPLARIMGLVGMLQDNMKTGEETEELLDAIVYSAHELDKVIRNICDNTTL